MATGAGEGGGGRARDGTACAPKSFARRIDGCALFGAAAIFSVVIGQGTVPDDDWDNIIDAVITVFARDVGDIKVGLGTRWALACYR